MNRRRVLALCEGALMVALSIALSYVEIDIGAQGGDVGFTIIPIIIFALRWGTLPGIAVGAVFGALKFFLGGYAFNWASILLDYAVAYGAVGLAGLVKTFKMKESAYSDVLAAFIGGAARFIVHFISGITVYAEFAPAGQHLWVYSLLYNGAYMPVSYTHLDVYKRQLETSGSLRKLYETDTQIHQLIELSKTLEGLPRNASVHASGIVITKEPIYRYVPLSVSKDVVTTQFTMVLLEELGLLKIDILGLRNITVIGKTVDEVNRKYNAGLNLNELDLKDQAVFESVSYTHLTTQLIQEMMAYIDNQLLPSITLHGVMMDIFGQGVLILGQSGIGKSETALELIERGNRLVADDGVRIQRVKGKALMARSPELIKYFMEIRGVGVIDVKAMFGIGSVLDEKQIDICLLYTSRQCRAWTWHYAWTKDHQRKIYRQDQRTC